MLLSVGAFVTAVPRQAAQHQPHSVAPTAATHATETLAAPEGTSLRRCFSEHADLAIERTPLQCQMEALTSQQHNPAAVLQQHAARASAEHLSRAERSSHRLLPNLEGPRAQEVQRGQDDAVSGAPAPSSSSIGGGSPSIGNDVPHTKPNAALEVFATSVSAPTMCVACAVALVGLACRLPPQLHMDPPLPGVAVSGPASSTCEAGPPDACMEVPTLETLSNQLAQSWLACMLATTLVAAAAMMARPAFAVSALPVRPLVLPCMALISKVLVASAVVLAAFPPVLRPPLWSLLVTLPLVRISFP